MSVFALNLNKFNYELMNLNGDIQRTEVWVLPAIAPWKNFLFNRNRPCFY